MPSDPFYTSAEWRAFRSVILRQRPVCGTPACGRPSKHADHIKSRRRGGAPFDPLNIQALCHSCHSRKTARIDGGFGNKRGSEAPLRTPGCDAAGRPSDPLHHWYGLDR